MLTSHILKLQPYSSFLLELSTASLCHQDNSHQPFNLAFCPVGTEPLPQPPTTSEAWH